MTIYCTLKKVLFIEQHFFFFFLCKSLPVKLLCLILECKISDAFWYPW